jgi:hypothetical protein
MKIPLILLCALALPSACNREKRTETSSTNKSQTSEAAVNESRPWIFFDMGKTLIDHGKFIEETDSFEKEWYMPGAYDYLRELNDRGYRLGMMINIPETWGKNYPQKLNKLEATIAKGWNDDPNKPSQPMFEFDHFRVIMFPKSDNERKGIGKLAMYQRAMELAYPCAAVFQGENPKEIEEAKKAGMVTWHVGKDDPENFFLPMDKISKLVKERNSGVICKGDR